MARKPTLDFLKTEAASGSALALAAVAALLVANSPWSADYFAWLKSYHVLQIGPIRLEETISDWIKEGLMAIFFLVVGLEIKYEIVRGELSDPRKLATPVLAALGGMAGPAAVYLFLSMTMGAPHAGWPIPLATDIAFALAVFAVAARKLPSSLRVFLLTLAIVDDLLVSDRSPKELGQRLRLPTNLLAHHLDVLEAAGLATAAAVWVASLKGFAQFGGAHVVEARHRAQRPPQAQAANAPIRVNIHAYMGEELLLLLKFGFVGMNVVCL